MSRPSTQGQLAVAQESEDEFEDEEDTEDEAVDHNGGFQCPETIAECHWQRRSVSSLYEMMSSPFLDLNPDYQRDVVWSSEKMTRLIDSQMCNYYVPPVIFNVMTVKSEDGGERFVRISIDGKQRLTSIREFINGNIPCTDKHGKKWFFKDNGDMPKKKKRLLDERSKRRFLDRELLCAEYSALERRQEEDLFSRVQLGVPLTPAEKIRASSGRWQEFALEIEREYPELMQTVDNKRGRGFQLILQIFKQVMNCYSEDQNSNYSAGAAALKTFCNHPEHLSEDFKTTARKIFRKYNEVRERCPETFENNNYTHAAKYSPIEFVAAAILIHLYPTRTNPDLLSRDILKMRQVVRAGRQDLRSNTATWRTLMEYIENLEVHRGGMNVTSRHAGQEAQDLNIITPGGSNNVPQSVDTGLQARIPAKRAAATSSNSNTPSSSTRTPAGGVRFEDGFGQHHVTLASQQIASAPIPHGPPTGPTAQRQYQTFQSSAPIAPLQQPTAPPPRDRFRAVMTGQSYGSSAVLGTQRRITDENLDRSALSGSSDHNSPQKPTKRARIEAEAPRVKQEGCSQRD